MLKEEKDILKPTKERKCLKSSDGRKGIKKRVNFENFK
jgi:hypothetical protein